MTSYWYSRWDGSQDPFQFHEDDIMEQLSDQLLYHGDVASALRSMIQRGATRRDGQQLTGIQDLRQRLRALRQQALDRYDLNSVADDIGQRLQDIIDTERAGIQRRLQETTSRLESADAGELSQETGRELLLMMEQRTERNRELLDQLPPDAAGRIRQLSDYDFMDDEARARFDELINSLQQRMLDSRAQDLSQQLQDMGSAGREGLKDMLSDLNDLLEQRLQGESAEFNSFRDRYGHLFGPEPLKDMDDLLQRMQQQITQMHNLLRNMSSDQRQELQQLLTEALQDPALQEEMERLTDNLQALSIMDSVERDYLFQGSDQLTLDEAMGVMEGLERMDELERQFRRTQREGISPEIDSDLVKELMGEEAYNQLEQLKRLGGMLEEAGYIRKMGSRYELTPRGMRKIGQKALEEIFALIRKDRSGSHDIRQAGVGGESQRDDTKVYEFGDPFHPDLQKTLMNAVQRGGGVPIRMRAEDFEVYLRDQESQASTVLMVDMSLSMAMRGNFLAAKKVALALDNLIRTQFPRDSLYIVGFSTYAREITPENLAYLNWDEFDPYTNIQDGLALARKLLARCPSGSTRQIIMVSDGEPTAHMESGQLFLQYPPSPQAIQETLREVKRCTHMGITINTFLLDRSARLLDFMNQVTRINRGRVFHTSPERLGRYLLVDYFSSRRRVVG
jgi:uncharacterized protein with von Willebrand factor type A (vWA) domain